MSKFNFQRHKLEEGEDYYQTVALEASQYEVVDTIAKIMSEYTEINLLPMKGFIWKALHDWQVSAQIPIADVVSMKPEQRIEMVGEIFDFLSKLLESFLLNSSDSSKLDTAIKNAYDHYKQTFAHR
ncbi:MAG: hypothetical protein INQ03_17715 [Candidatus Heimdallarchaeota archaeon]|nr:hypothetical protein [Candidatus Heimdallarchaeota archaeon]